MSVSALFCIVNMDYLCAVKVIANTDFYMLRLMAKEKQRHSKERIMKRNLNHQNDLHVATVNSFVGDVPFMTINTSSFGGAWVAQLVKHPTSAQVMISLLMSLSPTLGSLCADSSEPGACFGFCVSLSLCPCPAHTLSLSPSQK